MLKLEKKIQKISQGLYDSYSLSLIKIVRDGYNYKIVI